MNTVIDFESYYEKNGELSVGYLGVDNYVRDSYAYIVSVVSDDHSINWCGEVDQMIPALGDRWFNDPTNKLWAANSNFDETWFRHVYKYDGPRWQCILDMGRGNQICGNLAGITEQLNGRTLKKDLRDSMNKVHWGPLSPERKAEMIAYCLQDSEETMQAIPKMSLSPTETRLAQLTRDMNRRGLLIDEDLLDQFIETAERAKHANLLRIPWRHDFKPGSPEGLTAWCLHMGLVCPKSRDQRNTEFDTFLLNNPKVAAVVESLRTYETANKMLEKLRSIQRRMRRDGTVPVEDMYCGSPHTRRWSCRGVNFKNLERKPLYYDAEWNECAGPPRGMELQAQYIWLRHLIIPSPGKKLAILDFAQIEPRVLAWHVGDETLLDACRAGYGVYEAYARAHMKWTGGNLKKNNPGLYQNVKNNFLGSGYGLGASKLIAVAAGAGIVLTLTEAEGIIAAYRRVNPRVTNFWKFFDELIARTKFNRMDRTLSIEMPTGEFLHHFDVRPHLTEKGKNTVRSLTMKKPSENTHYCWQLWGGLLTENVTQRMARDVFGNTMLNLRDAGADVYHHAHDEVVVQLDDSPNIEKDFDEIARIMRVVPDWCSDLPLDVEGELHERYTKI